MPSNGIPDKNKWPKEIKTISESAKSGDARAMAIKSILIRIGEIGDDPSKAENLAKKSSESGNFFGYYALARIQQTQKNNPSQDYNNLFSKAIPGLVTAAEQSDPYAELYLSACYEDGWGIERNITKSLQLINKAAEQGFAQAQYKLGICYLKGQGVEQNLPEGFAWIKKAAEQGFPPAQNRLGLCYIEGQGVKQNLPEGFAWIKKGAEQGNARALGALGECYFNGWGVPKDMKKADDYLQEASIKGNTDDDLEYIIAKLFVPLGDSSNAFKSFQIAANLGNSKAQYELARYYNGEVVGFIPCNDKGILVAERQPKEAVKWYTKAADQGNIHAQLALGDFYYYKGPDANPIESFKLYKKAADQGNIEAKKKLIFCYRDGFGVSVDLAEAAKLEKEIIDQQAKNADERIRAEELIRSEKENLSYMSIVESTNQPKYFSPSNIKVKGLSIGMDIRDVPSVLDKLLSNSSYKYKRFSDKKTMTITYEIGCDSKIFAIGMQVNKISISSSFANFIFHSQDLSDHEFAKQFIDAYDIPELKPLAGASLFEKAWYYNSPNGVKTTILGNHGFEMKKIPTSDELKNNFN